MTAGRHRPQRGPVLTERAQTVLTGLLLVGLIFHGVVMGVEGQWWLSVLDAATLGLVALNEWTRR